MSHVVELIANITEAHGPDMRNLIVLAMAVAAALLASQAGAQTCLRPKWTECVSFPHGGRHTGINTEGVRVEIEVPPGPDICVSTEWEVRAETYALFERGGAHWPNREWEVDVDTFCFYQN
jgi:hypothetical protein